jgi:hypothetical protein
MDRCVLLAQQVIFYRREQISPREKAVGKQTGDHGERESHRQADG